MSMRQRDRQTAMLIRRIQVSVWREKKEDCRRGERCVQTALRIDTVFGIVLTWLIYSRHARKQVSPTLLFMSLILSNETHRPSQYSISSWRAPEADTNSLFWGDNFSNGIRRLCCRQTILANYHCINMKSFHLSLRGEISYHVIQDV